METSHRWDTAALRMGAMVSLIFAIPFSIGASWAASRDSTALAIWLVLGAIGGWIGRRLRAKGFVPSFERSSQ